MPEKDPSTTENSFGILIKTWYLLQIKDICRKKYEQTFYHYTSKRKFVTLNPLEQVMN